MLIQPINETKTRVSLQHHAEDNAVLEHVVDKVTRDEAGLLKRMFPKWLCALAVIGCFLCASACSQEQGVSGADVASSTSNSVLHPCIDADRDGFGTHCGLGPDCDDNDPLVGAECGPPKHRRPCASGATETCFVIKEISEAGYRCGQGLRQCHEQVWGRCEDAKDFVISASTSSLISGPFRCNPCDPACAVSKDRPDDNDLTEENSEDVLYDPSRNGLVLGEENLGGLGLDTDGDGVPDAYEPEACIEDPACDGFTEHGAVFHSLPFQGPAVYSPVEFDVELRTADIYFLMDTTGSMQGEIDNLRSSLVNGNFIQHPERCGLETGLSLGPWWGFFWRNRDLAGEVEFWDSFAGLDFNWNTVGPQNPNGDAFVRTNFSAWFETTFVLDEPTSGMRITHRSDDGIGIFLDGNTLVYDWVAQGMDPPETIETGPLAAGSHTLGVMYYQGEGDAGLDVDVSFPPADGYEGLVGAIRCEIANSAFGVGYFDDLPYTASGSLPYGQGIPECSDAATGTVHDLPYHQLLPITEAVTEPGRQQIRDAVGRLVAMCGGDIPESQAPALYSLATGAGIPNSVPGYATPPEQSVPLFVMDADPQPGPSPAAPGPTNARVNIGDITGKVQAYEGSTAYATSANPSNWCWANGTAPDARFDFSVTQPGRYRFSTAGSAFNTVITIVDSGNGSIGCNDDANGTPQSESTMTLQPGDYSIIVDGRAGDQKGDYRLTIASVAGESEASALDLGDLTGQWKQLAGSTTGMQDNYTDGDCYGGESTSAPDAVFTFTLSETTNLAATLEGSSFNSVLRLYDENFSELYCNNGEGNLSSIFQELTPGRYYVLVEGYRNAHGNYRLGIGTWGNMSPYWTPPQESCAEGAFGYPCFREGTIPVVVMFSDASFHNGPDDHSRYRVASPSYLDALYALKTKGVKVIGIHSGPAANTRCTRDCLSSEYRCEERTRQVCDSYSAPRTVCQDECVQGVCGTRCWEERDCLSHSTETYTHCWDECLSYGPEYCYLEPQTSEAHLREMAVGTDTVDENGDPLVFHINSDGTGLSAAVVDAIAKLAGSNRVDVTLRVNDNPGTALDERQFVDSIAAIPSAETNARCLGTFDTWFRKCLPGTDVRFSVGFQNDFVPPAAVDQVFTFSIDVMGDGLYLLESIPVTIVVPKDGASYPPEGWYARAYDSTAYCGPGQLPFWDVLSWDAEANHGTSIRFEFRSAETEAGVPAADPLVWTVPADASPVSVREALRAAGKVGSWPYAEVKAVLIASDTLNDTPVLREFDMRYRCESAD